MDKKNELKPPYAALYIIVQTVLVTLKLTGDLPWSWWLVPLPTYIYIGIGIGAMLWMGLWVRWVLTHADEEAIEMAKQRGAFKRFIQTINQEDEDEDE